MDYYNVTVVIPAYNPDDKLLKLVLELRDNGFDDIVIINDGSDEECRKYFPNVEKYPFCTVLTHIRNRGKGAALKTGFKFFLEHRNGKDGIITTDADGQHLTKDIITCAERMVNENRVILGSRDFSKSNVPKRSKIGNKITCIVFKLFCGLNITDTQTGLRAIPAKYIEGFMDIKGQRYEFETNMLLELKKCHIPYSEQSIETVYIEGNKTSHFRPVVDSLRIYKLIFAFIASSLISMAVELILFYLCLEFIFDGGYDVFLATAVSRVLSSIVNFAVNKKTVFNSKIKVSRALFRYIVVAIPVAIISMFSVKCLSLLVATDSAILRTLIKIVVDTILFFLNFRIQQNWVFAPSDSDDHDDNHKNGGSGGGSANIKTKKVKSNKPLTAGRVFKRSLSCIGLALAYLVVSVYVLLLVVAKGPSVTMRDALVLSAMQASATKWVPNLFLSQSEIDKIVDGSFVEDKLIIDSDEYLDNSTDLSVDKEELIDGMKFIINKYDNFKAYILLLEDPSRLYVGTSTDDYENAVEGTRMFDMKKKENFIAAINGGEFYDNAGTGTGARPMGLTYSKGKCVWNDGLKRTFIGIDDNNRLVVSESMSKAEADRIGIRDAVSFQNGNTLIKTDDNGVNIYYKNGNTGVSQRTAIGQRADGTFILVVTDGRTATSLGAKHNEVIEIMKEFGAVNAAMLDGGSSALMYYEDYYDKYDMDKSALDQYQRQGIANKYIAFSPPRRIPTYFCVKR